MVHGDILGHLNIPYHNSKREVDFCNKKKCFSFKMAIHVQHPQIPVRPPKIVLGLYVLIVVLMVDGEHPRAPTYIL